MAKQNVDQFKEHRLRYQQCMEEIKKRAEVIDGFITGKCDAMYIQTLGECMCLQLRKILELIALASLAANHQAYKKYRDNFERDWHSGRIFKTLEKINPDFYPQPTRQVLDETGQVVVGSEEIKTGFLTKQAHQQLYNICGAILHAQNPFFRSEQDIRNFITEVPMWMEKIRILLNHHHVRLTEEDIFFAVLMRAKSDENVQVAEFHKVPEEETERFESMTSQERDKEIGRMNRQLREDDNKGGYIPD